MGESVEISQVVGAGYITTIQGFCKLIEMIFSLIGVLLVSVNFFGVVITVYISASIISEVIGGTLFLIYVLALPMSCRKFPWNKVQFFCHAILSVYYLVAVSLVLHYGNHYNRIVAGAVFGLLSTVAHFIDAIDNYSKSPLFK